MFFKIFFRIATTSNNVQDKQTNNLYILNDNLEVVGKLENLAREVVNYGYGKVVTTNGMKMSLFDISDINNPIELYKVNIGEKGTYSEALHNHKAFLFSKEKNIIAFPISITKDNYRVRFQGAIVYGLDLDNGFTLRGQITHREGVNIDYSNNIERIIYIGDNLFTLSRSEIKATNLETMKEINSININDN